jgi:tRNA(Ile)-lysidine synthase
MLKKKNARRTAFARPAGSRRRGRFSELALKLARHLAGHPGLSAGQRVGVAVSGGADSVALLRVLLELREQLGIIVSLVHFNHQLRGKASDADEKFVSRLAAQYGLPFLAATENVAAQAKQQRANLEEVARKARYAFFERLADEKKVDRVAVAHTADDQAETVLSHILRGTGIAGLAGIHPEAGVVFRPLLKFRRAELRKYLRSLKQAWREDATNRDVTRTRARIRRRLIPLLEKQFQPAVVAHLCQLAEFAREDEAWLESATEQRVAVGAKEEKGVWRVPVRELAGDGRVTHGEHEAQRADLKIGHYASRSARGGEAICKRMIRSLVKKVKPRAGQLSAAHVEAALQLARDPDSGKALHLPGGVEVRRERDSVSFRPLAGGVTARDIATGGFAYAVDLSTGEAELRVVEHSWVLRFRVIDWPLEGRETKETGAVLDRDKLGVPLVVRNWRAGDAVQPLGHQKNHALSRLLNEAGVSRWEKGSWPVLTAGGKIAWTRGLPVAAEFAAGGSTRKGVVITEAALA